MFRNLKELQKEQNTTNIIIITTDNFNSYDYLEEILSSYKSSRFIFGTGMITEEKEDQIISVLKKLFNNPIISTDADIPKGSFNKRCLIFTDDMSEIDVISLSVEAKSLIPEYQAEICRKKTPAELIEIERKREKYKKQANRKEIIESAGVLLVIITFIGMFIAIINNDIFLNIVQDIVAIIAICAFGGGLLIISNLIYDGLRSKKANDKKIVRIVKAILGTLVIAGIIMLVIYLLGSSNNGCSTYINDAHRPDRW